MFKEFQTKIKTFLVAALVAGVVSIGGISLLQEAVRNQVSHTPLAAPSPQTQTTNNQQLTIDTAGWQTYRNEEFGFEVRYPNSVKSATSQEEIQSIALGYIRLCNFADTLACFYISQEAYPNSTFEAAALSVEILGTYWYLDEELDYSESEENCLGSSVSGEAKHVVNGVTFDKDPFGDGASGHTYGGFHYRTYYNGQCFQVTTGIATYGRAPSDFPERGIRQLSEKERNEIFVTLDQILSTFRFVE